MNFTRKCPPGKGIEQLPPDLQPIARAHLKRLLAKHTKAEFKKNPCLKASLTLISIRLSTGAIQHDLRKAWRKKSKAEFLQNQPKSFSNWLSSPSPITIKRT